MTEMRSPWEKFYFWTLSSYNTVPAPFVALSRMMLTICRTVSGSFKSDAPVDLDGTGLGPIATVVSLLFAPGCLFCCVLLVLAPEEAVLK